MSFLKNLAYAAVGFVVTGGNPLGAVAGFSAGAAEDTTKQQKKTEEATRRAQEQARQQYEAESKKAEIQNIRSVRQQVRQARIAQSSMLNVGAQTGGMGGSGLAGGLASVGSQLGGNLDYMSQIAKQNTAIGGFALGYSNEMANASIAASRQQLASTQLGLGMTIFGGMGGYDKIMKAYG